MKNHFTGKLTKKENKLVYNKQSDKKLYESFLKNIPEGKLVDIYVEVLEDNGTLAQLAKIHALLRELAHHTGMGVEDLKLVVKKRCGLCFTKIVEDDEFLICRSLGDASADELSLVIQECIRTGESVGLVLN